MPELCNIVWLKVGFDLIEKNKQKCLSFQSVVRDGHYNEKK